MVSPSADAQCSPSSSCVPWLFACPFAELLTTFWGRFAAPEAEITPLEVER